MNREQAKELIRDTFESPFDKGRFVNFIKNLLNTIDYAPFDYYGQYIPDPYKSYINRYERIGKYSDGENRIDILIIYLKKQTSIERARSMQRNFIAGYLKGNYGSSNDKDAALVAFVSPDEEDWRFSLVEMDYRFEEGKSGRVKVREEFTPARRWSFLVGKNEKSHTAQSRLVSILEDDEHNPTLKQLEEAFNIEPVTKEFFDKYRDLLIRTVDALDKIVKRDQTVRKDFESKNINTVDFAKKLLGQIVFLYFLQKKGWFGVERGKPWGKGPKDFMRRLFNKEYGDYENFFNGILEPLFYEALRTDRSSADHYYSRFNCKIPFLNGGLFDPINNYDWVNTEITIPDELFSNTRRTKEGDIGDGILDVFDRFNFTVNEEEPLEKEVALDPELLGKIYEKLNAIRPDNFDEYLRVLKSGKKGEEAKFNKEYGVYYTPREIVHYMCQESLINYLETELKKKCPREDIEKFVKFADSIHETEEIVIEKEKKIKSGEQKTTKYESQLPDSIKSNAKEIDRLLADIKVCDPAVGSGAFPIGMMHKIVKLRRLLLLFTGTQKTNYGLKRHCIENSLYGVDIDPGAVEICKLRFWLSMIVDEEDIYQIKPLPNLDYKIVCGDSLLGFPSNLNSPIEKEIQSLMDKYFLETNPIEKERLKRQIDERIKYRLEQSEKIFGYKINFDFPLFFQKVFREKNGFDVVIANPPYIKEYINRSAFNGLRDSPYYQGKMDIWYMFACRGIHLLKDKGILTFIAQNNWVTSYGASKMRNKVIKDTRIIELIDFGPYFVFENSDIQTMIMIFQKDSKTDNYTFKLRRLTGRELHFQDVLDMFNGVENSKVEHLTPLICRENFINNKLTFSNSEIEEILNKIKERSNFYLEEKEITQGIVPNPDVITEKNIKKIPKEKVKKLNIKVGDGVFVVDENFLKNLNYKEKQYLKELYEPSVVDKYYFPSSTKRYIIYITKTNLKNPKEIPNIISHLSKYKEIMEERRENKKGRIKFYHLHWPRDSYFFDKGPKILVVRKCPFPIFIYTEKEAFVMMAFNVIKTNRINLKYLTGLLNSTLIAFWLRHKGKMQGNNYQIDKEPLLALPIIKPSGKEEKEITDIVGEICNFIRTKGYSEEQIRKYQRQIDQLVYKLYNLTEEEIKIIEEEIR